jgi:aspartate racemase
MACISVHYFYPQLVRRSPLPILNLIDETLAALKSLKPAPGAVGLIATTGTVRSGIVAEAFEAAGIKVLLPSAGDQKRVMTAIYGRTGIKAGLTDGPPRELILEVARELVRRGAGAVVAGCTEVPLVLLPSDLPVPLVDPLAVGARAALKRAGARLRSP